MRRILTSVALVVGALFAVAPAATAQQLTVSTLKASYTPVGKLPAGTYGVTEAALPGTMVLDLRADFPKGELLVDEPGGKEVKYKVEFYEAKEWKGEKKLDKVSLHFEQGKGHVVSCTLARRDDKRFSGVCKDEAGLEGWLEVASRTAENLEPGVWYGPGEG